MRRRKRNTKVAVHPCPASFGAQDARRGGPVGHAWPSRGTGRARRGRLERRDGRAWTWMRGGVVRRACMCAPTSKRSDRLAQLATNAMEKRNESSDQVNIMRFRLR